jgi:hypothetical protein
MDRIAELSIQKKSSLHIRKVPTSFCRCVKSSHQVAVNLRLEDVTGDPDISGGPDELRILMDRQKNDLRPTPSLPQVFHDLETSDICERNIQKNNVRNQSVDLGENSFSIRQRAYNHEISLQQLNESSQHVGVIVC